MWKRNKWGRRILTFALAAGMSATSIPAYAAPADGGAAGNAGSSVQLPEAETIAAVDFSSMENLDSLPDGWTISNGSGSSELVDDGEGKALKLTRSADGGETSLANGSLDIDEGEYRYVTIDTKIKMGGEGYANQFSIPYIQDKSGTTVYTLYTDGDWTQYKSHVNGKNALEAGTLKKDQWQDVRMDIDMKTDTFRVSVDGEYLLAGVNARQAADSLQTIKYYADSWNRGTMYLKSVEVTAQTERTERTTFYVSNNGDDSADGQSPETAWKTLDRVNAEHFIPGDQILFECGGKWENQTLQPQGSGSADAMITIGNYGEGELPQIAANGKMKDALYLCNQQYWEISGLDISNTVEGFNMVSNGEIPTGNVTERQEDQGKLLGEYRGIHIAGRDVPSLQGFRIHDLKVHDVTGVVSWIGDTGLRDAGIMNNAGLDGSKRTGGILIECLSPTGNQATQFSDIVIEDNSFINNSFGAVTIKQWNGSGNQYGENPGWANRNGSGGAPDYVDSNWKPHSNIIIQDNYINQGASAYACNGIYLTSSRDSLIQRNVLENIGTCGIELYFTDNVAVQYNEVSNVDKKGGGADDNAIDPDWRSTNALIQYNYIHDCGEGLLLCGVQYNSGVIRYNLIQDCGRSYIHYSMGSGYFQIYNNVFYRSADGNGTNNFDPWGGGKATYFNNVFYDGKKEGFVFSGGTSFSYYNNAYYGTSAPGKDSNPIILTEDPFEGNAPSMDRKGTAESGVLLEANGLRPKVDSPLIAAGVSKDANGVSIDEGLKSKGTYFNFTPLDAADTNYLGDCIYISRTDYPTFEKTGAEATFDTAKTQTTADKDTPTIGMFEVPLDENAVILRGTVSDGINPLANADVEIKVDDVTINTTTGDSGTYSVAEGLKAGEATVTVRAEGREDISITVKLEAGKVNVGDVKVPLVPMPDEYEYVIFDDKFDTPHSENFQFTWGAGIENGQMLITKDMGNATAAVSYFTPEIAAQKGVDFSFDWNAKDGGNKMGLEFRDSYGRLLFAVCSAPGKNELRTSTTGDAVDDDKAASASEPTWSAVKMSTDKTYTFRVHADFEEKTVSFQLKEKDGEVIAQQLDIPTDAVNLAKMNACSWWDSRTQYIDNFRLTAKEKEINLPLKDKVLYAFGDSLIAGHQYQKASFADFAAAAEGMSIQKFAVNGATVMDAGYEGGKIATQVEKAPAESPDYILFDGGTNDAEYIANNSDVQYGEVTDSDDPASFDTTTFAGAFESLVYQMQQKYPDAQLVYTAVHKLGSRDNGVQEKLRTIELAVCEKYGVAVADVYGKTDLDTNDVNKKNDYTFDGLAANGLPGNNGSGTHPNFKAIEEFYVPVVTETLEDPVSFIPDTEEPVIVDKTVLETKLNEAKAEAGKTDVYTADSLASLNEAIQTAEAVFNDENASQEQVDAQVTALEAAMKGLVSQIDAEKESLAGVIAQAEDALKQTDIYTADSLQALQEALDTAKAVYDNAEASLDEVRNQKEALQTALDSLEEIGETDRTALRTAIAAARAEAEKEDVYTAESLAALNDAIEAAQSVLNDPNAEQSAIAEQTELVNVAVANLVKQETVSADKRTLEAKLDEARAKAQQTDVYTADSLAALKDAIQTAEAVVDDENASQEQVDAQVTALEEAVNALEEISEPVPTPVDRSALADKISEAEKLSVAEDAYTAESMAALKQAISDAKAVYDNADASQEEIDAQASALQTAIDGLKKADSGKPQNPDEEKPGQGGSGDQEQKPDSVTQQPDQSSGSQNNGSGSSNADKDSAPKTGDDTNIAVPAVTGGIALILIAAAVIVMIRKKRR